MSFMRCINCRSQFNHAAGPELCGIPDPAEPLAFRITSGMETTFRLTVTVVDATLKAPSLSVIVKVAV
jgi:hypothetical protein